MAKKQLQKIMPVERGEWSASFNGGAGYDILDYVTIGLVKYCSLHAFNTTNPADDAVGQHWIKSIDGSEIATALSTLITNADKTVGDAALAANNAAESANSAASEANNAASEANAAALAANNAVNNLGNIYQPIGNYATLGDDNKIPAAQLPSFVDDVIEASSITSFPEEGETGKIYVALDTNKTYRWGGSTYVVVGSDLAIGETTGTAYDGKKGKDLADKVAALPTVFAPADAQKNVQSDWNATEGDAFIKNKPTSLPANGGNAETVDGYHLSVGAAGTAASTIYFVI